jgi:chemotaxis protein CheD
VDYADPQIDDERATTGNNGRQRRTTGTSADDRNRDRKRVAIGIAEYAVTTESELLATSGLGSCVAIGLYDRRNDVAGLIHVMLPTAENTVGGANAKFADRGIAELAEELTRAGGDPARIEAKIAGGSKMLSLGNDGGGIGKRNVEATKEALTRLDATLVASDVGGESGRSVVFDPATSELSVKVARSGTHVL